MSVLIIKNKIFYKADLSKSENIFYKADLSKSENIFYDDYILQSSQIRKMISLIM
jgi:hypothetical protein